MSLLLLFTAAEAIPPGKSRYYADGSAFAETVGYSDGGLLQLTGQGPFYLTPRENAVAVEMFGAGLLRSA